MPVTSITKDLSFKTLGYISVIALSTLFYELSLIRILDILWYPHFAYMVISLALLGYGASGSFLTFFSSSLAFMRSSFL